MMPLTVAAHDRTHLRRAAMPERSVEEVLGEGNYVRIEEGLTDAIAHDEARRLAYFDFTRPATLCIGCGACAQVCPTGAIHIEDRDGVRHTIITGTVVREQPLLVCSECGAPTQTPAHRDFVRGRLPEHMAALLDRELCPSCARLRADRPRG